LEFLPLSNDGYQAASFQFLKYVHFSEVKGSYFSLPIYHYNYLQDNISIRVHLGSNKKVLNINKLLFLIALPAHFISHKSGTLENF